MAGSKRRKKRRNKHSLMLIALRHPLRRKILRLMGDGREASPSDLAAALDVALTSVAYHVHVLVECGALTPVGEEQVRGAKKHFYRGSVEAGWAEKMLEEDDQ